jgi:hypothetical protein
VAACVLAGACVHQGGPTVGVAKLEANLVFGVIDKAAPAPAGIAGVETPPGEAPPVFAPPSFDPLSTPDTRSESTVSCPKAAVTAAPEKPTEAFITGEPLQGIMQWKRNGSLVVNGTTVTLDGFESRIVRNYKKIDDNTFTFDTVQNRIDNSGYDVNSYKVRTNGLQTSQGGGTNSIPGAVPTVTVQEPDAGLTLTQRRTVTKGGTTLFQPNNGKGLLLLPLPVSTGQQWKSVAVDNKSGETVELDGTVTRRQRIDACGDLIDGWAIESQYTDSTFAGGTITYNYLVATQFGAMLVDEVFSNGHPKSVNGTAVPSATTASPFNYDFQLAQIKPDPASPTVAP